MHVNKCTSIVFDLIQEKLLNVGEKFSADKNLISRDLATQTQKHVYGQVADVATEYSDKTGY